MRSRTLRPGFLFVPPANALAPTGAETFLTTIFVALATVCDVIALFLTRGQDPTIFAPDQKTKFDKNLMFVTCKFQLGLYRQIL